MVKGDDTLMVATGRSLYGEAGIGIINISLKKKKKKKRPHT